MINGHCFSCKLPWSAAGWRRQYCSDTDVLGTQCHRSQHHPRIIHPTYRLNINPIPTSLFRLNSHCNDRIYITARNNKTILHRCPLDMKLHLLSGIISAPVEAEMILVSLPPLPCKTTVNRKITEPGAVVA